MGEGLSGYRLIVALMNTNFCAYVMGIPGLEIRTASTPNAAYGITKSMIRGNGPCFLCSPVKMMKEAKGPVDLGQCILEQGCVASRSDTRNSRYWT